MHASFGFLLGAMNDRLVGKGCLPSEPSEAITVAAHTWGGSALPVPWGGSSYMRWIYPDGSALPILEAVSLPRTRRVSVRAGSFKQPGWQALSPVTFPPSSQLRLMSGIKPTHAPAYQGKYLDHLISEWNWKLSTSETWTFGFSVFFSCIWSSSSL